ncbi:MULTISPECIES: PTS glucose transporter subunit IIA [unclassified Enterococcus]|uniref:PTS sugar transporter subunit IIA n=1 Tax=unclassified Enterococcus TaxID=2608891 RepID=UPI00155493E6|nr:MULTISPECIES: PTS glucose transporter subunit IIA [unclassified Enterococcus]MBS7577782.1 PTS glucose transporter subunit IIA [Enterococcus sp. MMGLQ5-2]MBS7585042.1 PTS glucose transporter subunit IIA [Enterococcus sp. MMGLQ5-1]NPD12898.1 PTS glucose transporter subunit IIA [Enterococcus sp. MMGLQ5-1]NPD37612.1 PTS glucose transporter subunit IIA [Enterococcus sp. MMGLQ5-2]
MFKFLKKKEVEPINENFYAVASGKLISMSEVNDPVFSQKMMGDGFAVIPENGDIYSPIVGQVMSIFQTKHAVGLKMKNGLEILLHMGIDTVELNGVPFDIKIGEGDQVTPETLIAKVNLDAITSANKGTEMVVVITNMDQLKSFELSKTGQVLAGEVIGAAKA